LNVLSLCETEEQEIYICLVFGFPVDVCLRKRSTDFTRDVAYLVKEGLSGQQISVNADYSIWVTLHYLFVQSVEISFRHSGILSTTNNELRAISIGGLSFTMP